MPIIGISSKEVDALLALTFDNIYVHNEKANAEAIIPEKSKQPIDMEFQITKPSLCIYKYINKKVVPNSICQAVN